MKINPYLQVKAIHFGLGTPNVYVGFQIQIKIHKID